MRENGEEAFARLVKAVEESQEVIRGHSLAVDSSEARTRMALIDPVLSALGWRTSNPAEVLAEYAVDAGRADYALLRSGTRKTEVLAFVEAKKLGEPLASHREQALRYATTAGVQFAALTNGDSWELYGLGGGAPRRMLNISLRARSARSCATQLLALRRESLESSLRQAPARGVRTLKYVAAAAFGFAAFLLLDQLIWEGALLRFLLTLLAALAVMSVLFFLILRPAPWRRKRGRRRRTATGSRRRRR